MFEHNKCNMKQPYETESKKKLQWKRWLKKVRKSIFIFSCRIYRNCCMKVISYFTKRSKLS